MVRSGVSDEVALAHVREEAVDAPDRTVA